MTSKARVKAGRRRVAQGLSRSSQRSNFTTYTFDHAEVIVRALWGARTRSSVRRLTVSHVLIAPSLPGCDRAFTRHHAAHFLRQPFEVKSHAGAFFVFLLLEPSGLLWHNSPNSKSDSLNR
jgi:hypothetical protein